MTSFFDTTNSFSTYNKLLQKNEEKSRSKRIAQAELALQQLKQDIDNRIEKLQGIFTFLDDKHKLYAQLTREYDVTPSRDLEDQRSKIQEVIKQVEEKLELNQPEQVIANLSSRYEELKLKLSEKKAQIKSLEEHSPDAVTHK